MKRILVSSVLALAFGCTERRAEAPAPDEPAPDVAAAAAPAVEVEARKVEITEDAVKRFVAAQKEILELSKTYASETLDRVEKVAKSDSAAVALKEAAAADEREKKFEADKGAIQKKSGLDEETWDTIEDLFDSLFTGRMAWRQAGGDEAMAKLEKDLKTQLASMPIEQRREAEPELMKLVDGMKGLRDGADAREKHGDAAVDLALRHGADIETLREDLFKLAIKRR